MTADGNKPQRRWSNKNRIPSTYRSAAKYLRMAIEEKRNIKTELYNDTHFRGGANKLRQMISYMPQVDTIIKEVDLATREPSMNLFLARVLIYEMLFRDRTLLGDSIPVQCIRRYEEEIRNIFQNNESGVQRKRRTQAPRFVRINTSALNLEGAKRMLQEEGWILVDEKFPDYKSFLERVQNLANAEYLIDFHFNDMLVFPSSSKPFWANSVHLKSKFFLQNKACLIPTYLLNPAKKSVVLDMCAAPGLKATHLASLMKNKGRLYAVERDAERYKFLCQQVTDFGVIKTIHADCLTVYDEQVPGVEYILLDPSCSGTGIIDDLSIREPTEDRLFKLAGLQYKLLSHAMNAFPNAKRIVYSTCSIYIQENEEVVRAVLNHNGHFKLLDARQELGKEWFNVGSSEFVGVGERCLYARPDTDLTIGMFVAVFERCAEGEVNEIYQQNQRYTLVRQPNDIREENYDNFEADNDDRNQQRKRKYSGGIDVAEDEKDFISLEKIKHVSTDFGAKLVEEKKKKKKKNTSKNDEIEIQIKHVSKDLGTKLANTEEVEEKKKKKTSKNDKIKIQSKKKKKHIVKDDGAELANTEDVAVEQKKRTKKKSKGIVEEQDASVTGNDKMPEPVTSEVQVEVKKSKKKKSKNDAKV